MKKMSRKQFVAGMAAAAASLSVGSALTGASRKATDKIKVCVFSKHLQFLDYADMARMAADIGFDGVALTVRPGGHVLPENVERDMPKAVQAVEQAGIKVYTITTRINDPDDVHTEKILKTARELGVKYYRMGSFRYDHSISIDRNLRKHRVIMERLAELNLKHNIHGAYQNHSGTQVGAPVWDLWRLLKGLDPRWIGCQYDVKHATQEGGTSWPLGLRLLKDHIKFTANKDFRWFKEEKGWRARHVPLGTGMVDFPSYFKLVKELGLTGPISMHFEYPLGGANHGSREITIPKREVVAAMGRDLSILRGWLKEYVN